MMILLLRSRRNTYCEIQNVVARNNIKHIISNFLLRINNVRSDLGLAETLYCNSMETGKLFKVSFITEI